MFALVKLSMTSKTISNYFQSTEHRETRADLVSAVKLVNTTKVAIDCGCGSGSDIAYLRSKGFQVHAFDIEPEAIKRCQKRFAGDDNVMLSLASFDDYQYPHCSLVVADSSLFFCPETVFDNVWSKITSSLVPGGVFVGSFLGSEDTMAGDSYRKTSYWPDVMVVTEMQIRTKMKGFNIVSLNEHKSSGYAFDGFALHGYAVAIRS